MLEFVKDNKQVRLWYQFNSRLVDDECWEKYDFDEFHYDIDIDEVKEEISYRIAKITNDGSGSLIILDALNELDQEELVDWVKIIRGWEDVLLEQYEYDAMEYFIEKHQEFDEEDEIRELIRDE